MKANSLPLKSKEEESKCIFLLFSLICVSVCFFVSMFCFLNSPSLLALCGFDTRAVKLGAGRPLCLTLDQRFPNTPVKPHISAVCLTFSQPLKKKLNNSHIQHIISIFLLLPPPPSGNFPMFPEGGLHLSLGTTALDLMGPCCCNSELIKMYYDV